MRLSRQHAGILACSNRRYLTEHYLKGDRAHVHFAPFSRLEALLRQTRYKRLRWVKRPPGPRDNPPPVDPGHIQ